MVKTIGNVEGEGFIISPDRKIGGIHRKVYTSAAEVTHTGNENWTDTAKTFDLTAPVNSLIIGINVFCELKLTHNDVLGFATLKINGTNLGTYYCVTDNVFLTQAVSELSYNTFSPTISSSQSDLFCLFKTPYYCRFSANINKTLKILDTTTNFTVQLKVDVGARTVSLKNVVVEVIYIESFEEDV